MKDEEIAEEWVKDHSGLIGSYKYVKYDYDSMQQAFLAGLKAGRPQWHRVADGDFPEVDNRIVLCVCGNGYIDGKRNYKLKLLTRKEFPIFQPVIKWCEIPTFDKE